MEVRARLPSARAGLIGASALILLAGCEQGQPGFSGRNAEWARARGDFSVVSASAGRAVVSANGNQVAVEPPPGFCLAKDEIETSDRSAFVLIGDCVLEDASAGSPAAEPSPGMPGIITVSISGDPGFSPGSTSPGELSHLEGYLKTEEGRALLGRGGDGSQVSVIETRRQGDILYVLVEDRDAGAVPLLAPRFWRAFVELNERLAVVTVSGFRDVPMDEDQMLRYLSDQVRHLQMANLVPVEEAPIQVAAATPRPRPQETGSGDELPEEPRIPAETGEPGRVEIAPGITVLDPTPSVRMPGWSEMGSTWADLDSEDEADLAAADTWHSVSQGRMEEPVSAGSGLDRAPVKDQALALAAAPEAADDPWAGPAIAAESPGDLSREAAGASASPEPIDGWAGMGIDTQASPPAERTAALTAGPWLDQNPVVPEPRPLVISPAEGGAQVPWPMPEERPGTPSARRNTPTITATAAAPASTLAVPRPPRRLLSPAEDVSDGATGIAVPLPPERVQP